MSPTTAQSAASRPGSTSADPDLTVGDVAAASGVAPSAVRFYEQHGVVTAVRNETNQRRFSDSAACRIQVARLAQQVGLTIREIAEVFSSLPADPRPEDWRSVADQLVVHAEARVAALRAHLADLESGEQLCHLGAAI